MKLRLALAALLVATPVAAQETIPAPAPAPALAPEPAPAPASTPLATTPEGKVILPPEATQPVMLKMPRLRYANTWDVNLEFGLGSVFRDSDRFAMLGRGRFGALFVRENHFWQIGATVEYLNKVERPAFGIQGEYLNLEKGVWAQVGGNVDTKGHPGFVGALGFSIIGAEVQVREYEGDTVAHAALLGKIRIPLGILAYAIGERGGKL